VAIDRVMSFIGARAMRAHSLGQRNGCSHTLGATLRDPMGEAHRSNVMQTAQAMDQSGTDAFDQAAYVTPRASLAKMDRPVGMTYPSLSASRKTNRSEFEK
jgi:hypothetical protein